MSVVLAIAASLAAAAGLVELRPPRKRPPSLHAIVKLGRTLGIKPATGLSRRIAAAGLDRPTSEVVALQAGLALLTTLAATPLATQAPGRLGVVTLLAAPAAGFLAPEYALRRRARTRAKTMELELPDVLDLLRVAIAAGQTPRKALKEVGRRHPGLLAQELQAAAARADLGEPADQALARLEHRAPIAKPLVTTLKRAERHGAPLSTTLTALAREARSQRAAKRSVQAAKAAPKIQLVVALLLVPAVLLLVAAALLPALTTR